MRLSIHKAEKKSEYIYSRSREVRKENPHPTIDIPTEKTLCFIVGFRKFLYFRELGFSNSAKKLVFRTFFSNANNSQFVNTIFNRATLCVYVQFGFVTLLGGDNFSCSAKRAMCSGITVRLLLRSQNCVQKYCSFSEYANFVCEFITFFTITHYLTQPMATLRKDKCERCRYFRSAL